jgi:prevent-host-death family protein
LAFPTRGLRVCGAVAVAWCVAGYLGDEHAMCHEPRDAILETWRDRTGWRGLGSLPSVDDRCVRSQDRLVKQVNIHEAKTQLSRLLEEVEGGERVVIARAGEPVAVLSPYTAAPRRRRLGLFAGEATMHANFDELPPDIAAAFGIE